MTRSRRPEAVTQSSQSVYLDNNEDSITVSSPLLPLVAQQSYEYPDPEDDPFAESVPESIPETGLEYTEVSHTKTAPKAIREETSGSTKVIWTYAMEDGLFTTLLDKVRSGKRADSGFKQEAWVDALGVVRFRAPLHLQALLSVEKLKNKESNIKALYKDWKWLLNQSGFGVHPETRVVTAPDSAWDEVLKVCFLMLFQLYLLRA